MIEMDFLIIFSIVSILNVVLATIKSLLTVKGNKYVASLMSGIYFSYYNLVLIYTVADFPMWQKCLITFFCNVLGVYIVKLVEEKTRKIKLWKVELTVEKEFCQNMKCYLSQFDIPHNYIDVGKWCIYNVYCENQEQSRLVREIAKLCEAKYFVSENIGL